jgi:hypothetical protein
MDIENRVMYYLGNLYQMFKKGEKIEYQSILNENEEISYNKIQLINNNMLYYDNYNYQIRHYINDLRKYFTESQIEKFLIFIAFGDINVKMKQFCFTKSRPVDLTNNFNILLNLNTPRHWCGLEEVNNYDIPFDKKDNKIIWRGASTGKDKRVKFVEKFQNHPNKNIDVKFSNLCQNISNNNYILNKLSIKEQLQSKFLISIEGNDVATNLKWILYSNSVVIMPKPTISSWIMEDKLIPGTHYVEIKSDYSDLEERYNWCLNNLEECKKIAENGKKYIQQFLDKENEIEITKRVIEIYCNTVIIKNVTV